MSTKKLLLVEDNPDDIELTLRALKKNNIMNEVVIARDGEEALRILFGPEPGWGNPRWAQVTSVGAGRL